MDCSEFVQLKSGIEIGGPSSSFQQIYARVISLDNVVFSKKTIWYEFQSDEYNFYPGKRGRIIEAEATSLPCPDNFYDFALSSHNLEHIANPLKALFELKRVIKKGGYIIIILPEKSKCFDHNRQYTTFDVLLDKYKRNVGEDNLDSLVDILSHHDLSMDPAAGTFEQFVRRSLDNYKNRCLHHHVFNYDLISAMCDYVGLQLLSSHINGIDMWFVLKS